MTVVDSAQATKPFGGIIVVFGGNYRQILPVILKAPRAVIVGATLIRFRVRSMSIPQENMWLQSRKTPEQNLSYKRF